MSILGLVWTGLYVFYSLGIKPVKDTGNFIEPFREKCVQDQAFSHAVDAVGMIDELLSCHGFAGQMSHATTLPTVTNDAHHLSKQAVLRILSWQKKNRNVCRTM
jgi:hypothetical protein